MYLKHLNDKTVESKSVPKLSMINYNSEENNNVLYGQIWMALGETVEGGRRQRDSDREDGAGLGREELLPGYTPRQLCLYFLQELF